MLKLTSRYFALLVVTLAGCTGSESEETEAEPTEILVAPLPGEGIQLRMVSTVAPGEEHERCQFFTVPEGGLNLNRERVRWGEGSHHVVLFATAYTSVPKSNLLGEKVDTSGVFDCTAGVLGSWDITGFAAAAQTADAPDTELPEGVAIRIPAGSVVLMNTHYLNTTSEPLETDTRMNLYSIPDAAVKAEAGFLTFYDPFIRVPAMGSAQSARMSCPVPSDVNLVNVTSHMHRRGVHFEASVLGADGKGKGKLFETDEWADVPTKQWPQGKPIAAGSAIEFHCDFENPESDVVVQGPTTKDEMCVLLGVYYPRDPALDACSAAGIKNPGHDATWYGNGELSCLQAVQCVSGAADEAGFYGCVVDSCPASGPALSALLHCQIDATKDAKAPCYEVCLSDDAACQSCVLESCGAELGECAAASCK